MLYFTVNAHGTQYSKILNSYILYQWCSNFFIPLSCVHNTSTAPKLNNVCKFIYRKYVILLINERKNETEIKCGIK